MKVWRVFALVIPASAWVALVAPPAVAQECRWDGTAPWCAGECGEDETEITRLDKIPEGWHPPFVNANPPFGSNCGVGPFGVGTKALCCKMRGVVCRWDGTAPFCDGECRPGETPGEPPAGSSSGASCWTGNKVYCCRNIGAVGSRLEVASELTRYAAIWDKTSGPIWQARHGLTAGQHQQVFDDLTRKGYRPVEVNGYGVGGEALYASVFEQRQGPPWTARHGMSAEQHQQEFDRLTRESYRLVDISGYTVGNQDLYASIWEQRPGPAWIARHGLTAAVFQQEFDRLVGQGYRLIDVSGYNVRGEDRYAGIWELGPGPAWKARHGMSADQYQQEFNNLGGQGYRLVRISGWPSGGAARFAAIWERDDGPPWVARHGMVSDVYQEEFFERASEGYRLRRVSGYHTQD
jgi:hypothetical protein